MKELLNDMSLFMSVLICVCLSGQSVHSGDGVSLVTYANLKLQCEMHESQLIVVMNVRAWSLGSAQSCQRRREEEAPPPFLGAFA